MGTHWKCSVDLPTVQIVYLLVDLMDEKAEMTCTSLEDPYIYIYYIHIICNIPGVPLEVSCRGGFFRDTGTWSCVRFGTSAFGTSRITPTTSTTRATRTRRRATTSSVGRTNSTIPGLGTRPTPSGHLPLLTCHVSVLRCFARSSTGSGNRNRPVGLRRICEVEVIVASLLLVVRPGAPNVASCS